MHKIDHKVFYTSYASDYHLYKLATLKSILTDIPKFEKEFLQNMVTGTNESRYTRFIKSEIRMTCFHAIETLFELIFALQPKGNELQDEKLMKVLSTVNFSENYKKIDRIAKDEDGLNFLDSTCEYQGNSPVWSYIFYFGYSLEDASISEVQKTEVQETKEAIKIFLRSIADIFSYRAEYNAYKHGLRILNTITDVSLESKYSSVQWDVSDSMSLFSVEKDKKKPIAEIIDILIFDTPRDMEIIQICSLLIHNIIVLRKEHYLSRPRASAYFFTAALIKESLQKTVMESGMSFRNPIKN